jgi:hypothetical protein
MGEGEGGFGFLRAIAPAIMRLMIVAILVVGGSALATLFYAPSHAWGESASAAENTMKVEDDGSRGLKLALGCPAEFTDGNPHPPDINVLSCHTEPITCQEGEALVDCGKRALMAGDWETAIRVFERAPDSGEAIYGRYLARLFRLYAAYNNDFFGDVFGEDYNQLSLTRDLNTPLNSQGRVYIGHYVCLANRLYFPGITQYQREQLSIEHGTSFIDKYLAQIVDGQYTLTGLEGGPLAIRWTQGKCSALLYDAVYQGIWDWVDAVLIYQSLFGSPAETKRWDIGLLKGESNTAPCPTGDEVCGPYSKPSLDDQEQIPVPRLSNDGEWFLSFLLKASQRLFEPGRVLPGREPVFIWRDTNANQTVDASDGFAVQLYKTGTADPILALEQATLGAQWTPGQAAPPSTPTAPQTFIFCPNGKDAPDCHLLPGEQALEEKPPVWQQLGARLTRAFPSPDGTKLVVTERIKVANAKQTHLFVTDNALDDRGEPICSAPDGNCCLTCAVLPQGLHQALSGAYGDWIADPTNPKGPARGIFFMDNAYPSAWGSRGQGMGGQFYAIHPDGTGFSALLENTPPFAMHYQPHIAPDGSQLMWSSTWDPTTGKAGTHTLLLADIVEQAGGFRLANLHSVVPVRDHGWYEVSAFADGYPNDRRIFFTSSGPSMQSPRNYAATLTPDGVLAEIFKLTNPDEVFPDPFVIDLHPGWYEFPTPMDQGRQVIFNNSDPDPVAADRFDRFLTFPPYLEGVLYGLTIFNVRFAGLDDDLGYARKSKRWLANIDGTNRRLLYQTSMAAGWTVVRGQEVVLNGQIFFRQANKDLRKLRAGVIKFGE